MRGDPDMSTVLFTTHPATGHVRPLLPVAREIADTGHEVHWYTGRKFEPHVVSAGARFLPITADLPHDTTGDSLEAEYANRQGLLQVRRVLTEVFLETVPAYVADLERHVEAIRPDAVVADHGFVPAMFLAARRGVPSVVFGLNPLSVSSVDTAPFGTGLAPSSSPVGRLRNRALYWIARDVLLRRAHRAARDIVAAIGCGPYRGLITDWPFQAADRYLQTGLPEFEYPRSDMPDNVEFIGVTAQEGVDEGTPPGWWEDVARARAEGRPVVVVTQGTTSTNPGRLLLPAIEGLAGRRALVVATTAGRDPDDVLPPHVRPDNLRIEGFVPFSELLPAADLLVCTGGFGSVQIALSHGVPLVVAGTTEDKMESNARVEWSGVGVSLRTDRPRAAGVRAAVERVLADPGIRARSRRYREALRAYGGASRGAEVVLEEASRSRTEVSRRREARARRSGRS
ncbi:MGT family glycosyltransferase [Nocardiopsis sp. Huas11]|uniref:glycosyltransferase n=1 Tax=Nocardiopsis sp. Huas11 TaxID=2183912 RepID=UPI000F14AEFB|nr:nucleotide disphospho-sugar-binding domain-containing protein [Nocardiopsis sp. Huas11]RKS10364.1 MGT family glycosyltransferase [Nocardiopsis sp. Huas11]